MMPLHEAQRFLRVALASHYPPEEVRAIERRLLGWILNLSPSELLLSSGQEPLSPEQEEQLRVAITRLAAHKPIQYIIGTAPFGEFTLEVAPGVLIPRPETEELAHHIMQQYRGEKVSFLDIATGSGCLALFLALTLSPCEGYAFDISESALTVAERNRQRYTRELGKNSLHLFQADMCCPETVLSHVAPIDFMVSNPPYIAPFEQADMQPNVLNYEPHEALFAPKEDPIFFYRALARLAKALKFTARPKLFAEINPLFASETQAVFLSEGPFTQARLIQDLSGRDRFIEAWR